MALALLLLALGVCIRWLAAPVVRASTAHVATAVLHETKPATLVCQPQIYIVQTGDTLASIARRFSTEIATLVAANQIANPNFIRRGQALVISCRNAPPLPARLIASPLLLPTVTPTMTPRIAATVTPILPFTATLTPMPQVLGYSTQNQPIEVYRFGNGPRRLAFIGGIHGGYEWNTILLAYEAIDYFAAHPETIPPSVTLYIIPAANPDGQRLVVGHAGHFTPAEVGPETRPGRFNGNGVDLNRNWDCNWNPIAQWGRQPVSGGEAPFSEVETQLLRTFLTRPPLDAVVFWHSAVPGVFPGGCDGRYPAAETLAMTYANAAGYPFSPAFTSYSVTGDATDWLARQGIPAITVELTNHTDTEWPENLRGMMAVLALFAEDSR